MLNVQYRTIPSHIYLLAANLDFLFKSAFEFQAAIFETYSPFFELVICPCFRLNPYTRMCVSTLGSCSLFVKKVNKYGNTLVASWICSLSLRIISLYIWRIHRGSHLPPRVGDHFQVLKVSEWVGDHFQVLKVSEGTCTVLRTYLPTYFITFGCLLGSKWGLH